MNRFFRYSGSKINYVPLINNALHTNKQVYCEPFVGSGAILFNITRKFDKYIINDIDRNIISMYKSFKEIDYVTYNDIVCETIKDYGSFKLKENPEAKSSYYTFRNWFNNNYWGSDTMLEGVYLHILANSCINSFLRFGPNGMNQSFGNRFYKLEEHIFNNIKVVLNKTEIHNTDYKELLMEDAFFFFDPPYASQDSSYAAFNDNDLENFIYNIQGKDYLYTDILNDINDSIQHKLFIREMRSTSPQTNKQLNGNMEYLFSSNVINMR